MGPRGITATVVHGGLIDTDMNPADRPGASALSRIPALGRYGTGTAITVDGGFAA
jgi:3-oxoacyl-[acyl-carrier protein] reductase